MGRITLNIFLYVRLVFELGWSISGIAEKINDMKPSITIWIKSYCKKAPNRAPVMKPVNECAKKLGML